MEPGRFAAYAETMSRGGPQWGGRPHGERVLAGPTAVVAVVGPLGAGKSSLLIGWAREQPEAVWFDDGELPGLRPGSVIVVDDADELDAVAWKQLTEALQEVPRLRVRLALRVPSVLPDDWGAEIISPHFTPDEVDAYLAACGSPADPRAVYALTAGHRASVVALGDSGAATPGQLAEALAADTTGTLPEGVADLAVPDHLTASVVAEFGFDDGVVSEAERAGWGGWSSGPGPALFVLTPRLRAATRRRFPVETGRQQLLRARAAELLLAEGAHFPALVEAVAADRLDLVDAALKRGGLPVLLRYGYELALLLDPLPVLKVRRYPVIAMTLALVYNARQQNRLKAIEMVGLALAGARLSARSSPDRPLLRVVESVGMRITGIGDGGVRAARDAAQGIQEMTLATREGLAGLEPDLHLHIAISLFYGGADEEASEEFERAWHVNARSSVQLMALGGRAMIEVLRGDVHSAQEWITQATTRSWSEAILDDYAGSMLRIAQAAVAVERLDFIDAQEQIASIWPHVDTIEHWPLLAHLRAMVDLAQGDADLGLERFQALRQRRSARRGATTAMQRRLDVTESLLLLATGQLAAAKLRPGPRDRPDVVLAAARVALLGGDHQRALTLTAGSEARTPLDRFTRSTLEAVLASRLGRPEAAAKAARRAAAISSSYGVRSPLMFVPQEDQVLFSAIDSPRATSVLCGSPALAEPLTPRELVVLRELVVTASVQQIAARLQVSANTVKSQRRSIYRKLGASSREDAITTAMTQGLLDT